MASDAVNSLDTDDDGVLDVDYYRYPDADGIDDPYLAKVWQDAADQLNAGVLDEDEDEDDWEDEDEDEDEEETDADDWKDDWDEDDEVSDEQFAEVFDAVQFAEEPKSNLQRLRDFLDQNREMAIKQVNAAARRIRNLRNLNTNLPTLAGIITDEVRGLLPVLQENLLTSMIGGAALGAAQTEAVTGVKAAGAAGTDLTSEALASLLFQSAFPPRSAFPILDTVVSVLQNQAVAVGADFHKTAQLVREGAFAVSGDLTEKALLDVRNELNKAVAEGQSQKEFVDTIAQRLEDAGSPLSPGHLENVFRTNVMAAMSDAQHDAVQNPMVADAFPYAAYSATHDGRVREEHLALERLGLDGTNIYRVSDPTFQMFRPPWAFNCRCTWTPTSVEMAARKGVQEAIDWMERAEDMARERGGSLYQYLNATAPQSTEYVSPPPFLPDPEFQRTSVQYAEVADSQDLLPEERSTVYYNRVPAVRQQKATVQHVPPVPIQMGEGSPHTGLTTFGQMADAALAGIGASIGNAVGQSLGQSLTGNLASQFAESGLGIGQMIGAVVVEAVREGVQGISVNVNAPIQLAEQPAPTVIVNVPEQAPPSVNVNVPAPIVNVAAPTVNVAAPSSKSIKVDRDKDGNIVGLSKE